MPGGIRLALMAGGLCCDRCFRFVGEGRFEGGLVMAAVKNPAVSVRVCCEYPTLIGFKVVGRLRAPDLESCYPSRWHTSRFRRGP